MSWAPGTYNPWTKPPRMTQNSLCTRLDAILGSRVLIVYLEGLYSSQAASLKLDRRISWHPGLSSRIASRIGEPRRVVQARLSCIPPHFEQHLRHLA